MSGCSQPYLLGTDPAHPSCSTEPWPHATLPQFALVLHGGVSMTSGAYGDATHKGTAYLDDEDRSPHEFVNVSVVHEHLTRFLMQTSGGEANFDVFIHTSVPSRAVQQALLRLYRPTAAGVVT
eukprot:2074300-Prymnesium_polylepis.1